MTINFGTPIVSKVSEIDLSVSNGPYGTHDTMRKGFLSVSHSLAPKHDLQKTLASVERIEEARKMYVATATLGTHVSLRLGLEKDISKANGLLGGLKSKRLTASIIAGTDEDLDVPDIFAINPTIRSSNVVDAHDFIQISIF